MASNAKPKKKNPLIIFAETHGIEAALKERAEYIHLNVKLGGKDKEIYKEIQKMFPGSSMADIIKTALRLLNKEARK